MSKTKADWPVRTEVQDFLERYEISSAAYHGGDLNFVCAHCLLANAETVFEDIQGYFLHYEYDDNCSDEYILHFCKLNSSILAIFDLIQQSYK
jgi:hypothetical protein